MSSAEEEVPFRYVHFRVDSSKVNAKHQMAAAFANNYISTTLYTVLTFLPVVRAYAPSRAPFRPLPKYSLPT